MRYFQETWEFWRHFQYYVKRVEMKMNKASLLVIGINIPLAIANFVFPVNDMSFYLGILNVGLVVAVIGYEFGYRRG